MAIPYPEMRSCVIAALRIRAPQQYESFVYTVASVLRSRGHQVQPTHGGQEILLLDDRRFYREVIWELIGLGIMAPGMDSSNEQWPFLSVTDYGALVLDGEEPSPAEDVDFLRSLTDRGPMDDVEHRYVRQALLAYRASLWDASAVMLGAAAEHLMEVLVEALATSDPAMEAKLPQLRKQPALRWLKDAHDYLRAHSEVLDQALKGNLDTTFAGLAACIRVARNDAGHPAGGTASDRYDAFANLQLYRIFRRWVMACIRRLPPPPPSSG